MQTYITNQYKEKERETGIDRGDEVIAVCMWCVWCICCSRWVGEHPRNWCLHIIFSKWRDNIHDIYIYRYIYCWSDGSWTYQRAVCCWCLSRDAKGFWINYDKLRDALYVVCVDVFTCFVFVFVCKWNENSVLLN